MKKSLFIVSVVMNILLISLILLYVFTPLLDFTVVSKSLPRMCQYVERTESERYQNMEICHAGEVE